MQNIAKHIKSRSKFLLAILIILIIGFMSFKLFYLTSISPDLKTIEEVRQQRHHTGKLYPHDGDKLGIEEHITFLQTDPRYNNSSTGSNQWLIEAAPYQEIVDVVSSFHKEYRDNHINGRFPTCEELQLLAKDAEIKSEGTKCYVKVKMENMPEYVYAYDNDHKQSKNDKYAPAQCFEVSYKQTDNNLYRISVGSKPSSTTYGQVIEDSATPFSDICIKN